MRFLKSPVFVLGVMLVLAAILQIDLRLSVTWSDSSFDVTAPMQFSVAGILSLLAGIALITVSARALRTRKRS